MLYQNELDVALRAVRSASRLCTSVRSKLNPRTLEKLDRSPVTIADFGSQALVCHVLAETFPDDPIIAEENSSALREPANLPVLERVVEEVGLLVSDATSTEVCQWIDRGNAQNYSDRFWTLDPIDGTKGFLRDDQYAVALALIVEGEPAVAAMACPKLPIGDHFGTVFLAVRGAGAFVLPIDGPGDPVRIHVSRESDAAGARFCESFESEHSSHGDAAAVASLLQILRPPLRLDSQAKYGVVARGEAEIYMRLPKGTGYVEHIWDHAAGALVVTEAGGRVSDVEGRPLDFRHGARLERNVGIVATNGVLHGAVLAALEKVLVST